MTIGTGHSSLATILYVANALLAAIMVHLLYRLAEKLKRQRRIGSRDWIMLPGLGLILAILALELKWANDGKSSLVPGVAFMFMLGMNIGKFVPRPSRGRR